MFKVGIIGCGRVVEEGHAPAYKEIAQDAQVTALADSSPQRCEKIGSMLNVGKEHWYADYGEMIKKEKLDFVDIALPHFLHEKVLIDVANTGTNIISEKPLATNLEEVDRILKAAEKNKILLAVLHNYSYNPYMKKAVELVKSGAIGQTFIIRSEGLMYGHYNGTSAYDPSWRTKPKMSGGGCLIDNGYHNIYTSMQLMDSEVTSVYAQVNTYSRDIEVDDNAFLLLKHANDGTTSIQVSWAVKAGGTWVNEVHGKKGSLFFHRDGRALALYSNESGVMDYPDLSGITENSFAGIFQDIFRAAKTGAKLPADGHAARRNIEIILAAYKSARTGEAVKVK